MIHLCLSSVWVTHMGHQLRPSLVQIMGCHLVSAKSLSELMLNYYVLDPLEQTSKFYLKFKHFHSRKCIWKYCLKMSTILSQSQCVKVSIIEVRAWMRHGWLIISWQKTGDRVTYSCLDLVSCRGLRLHWGYIRNQGIVAWSDGTKPLPESMQGNYELNMEWL